MRILLLLILLVVIIILVTVYAGYRYERHYKNDVISATVLQPTGNGDILQKSDVAHLPIAVQRYLRYARCLGKPRVNNFKVCFEGGIRKNEQAAWMPFKSEQHNYMANPERLFFMKAKMMQLPVAGYHCYRNGKAYMDIRLLSLFKVQYQDGPQMDTAETVTFFNDMCCMAPATLIDRRIIWGEATDSIVKAKFTNNGITIAATLYFNEDGALVDFVSNDRYATEDNGVMNRVPWSTPITKYREFNGYYIGSFAKAIYHYPAGDFCYGTFRLTQLEYNAR